MLFNDGGEAEKGYGGEYGSGEQAGGGGGGWWLQWWLLQLWRRRVQLGVFQFYNDPPTHCLIVMPRPNAQILQRHVHVSTVARKVTPRPTAPTLLLPVNSPVPVVSVNSKAIAQPTAQLHLLSFVATASRKVIQLLTARILARSSTMMSKNIEAEVAWANLIKQSKEGDFDDMKDEAMKYIKASPDATYPQLEKAFRNLDRKYSVSWRKSPKHSRPKEKENWPATPEENLERLADAGQPVDRGIPLCTRCNELGHISKHCSEEPGERERVQVQCYNCNEIGHRVRDCPIPREDKFACRNCKKSGHNSKECPEPRSAEGVECKNCNEIGHFSRDCPTGGGGDGGLCRNCNQPGHRAKDCTNERVIILSQLAIPVRNAQSLVIILAFSARTASRWVIPKVRCKEPVVEEDGAGDAAGYGGGYGDGQVTVDAGTYGGGAAIDEYAAPTSGGDDNWGAGGDEEVAAGAGW
ncbi:hypothetical protein EYC84_010699 [Monilinia fructicola]|uniref:CCHC-type domain-containing protein n=1 Tax=Monilinia fructicola TaxID=38448 RepID=A0A5M9JAL5_MONFR|nr:hypothetical protein EYC84_010699 [Monilinia fructicola]